MTKTLERDNRNKMVAGVVAGFSNYFKQDVTLLRIGVVAIALITGVLPVLVFYVVSWFIMPDQSDVTYTVLRDDE